MEVPSEVLQKLLCENCDGYLSRGPVHLMENVRYRCGRCLPSEEEQGTRIEVYEELAKLMTFPCRYREKGCPSKVSFMENESHEDSCPYREQICPIAASGQCEWTGIQKELLEHCQQEHPDNVVENPCKFTHNITRNSLNNYLLWTLGVLFLVQTKVCMASRKIYHSVRMIGDPATASNYKYTLCIQNKDSRFYKDRKVAPRGYLALQIDSSIQTDINGLLTMLEDFRDTTFTVTIESTGNGTTDSSTAKVNSSNTLDRSITPAETLECYEVTEPVYRQGWPCRAHILARRPCRYSTQGCTYTDVDDKCEKHKWYYCQYSTWCDICSKDITGTTRDSHYTYTHCDITYKAGTVCTVRREGYFIIDCAFGRVVCLCYWKNTTFRLRMYASLPSEQLYKYRCAVEIGHPDTGYRLICTPIVQYNTYCDWEVQIPRTEFDAHIYDSKIILKINITKIGDQSGAYDVQTSTSFKSESIWAKFCHFLNSSTKSKQYCK